MRPCRSSGGLAARRGSSVKWLATVIDRHHSGVVQAGEVRGRPVVLVRPGEEGGGGVGSLVGEVGGVGI